MIDQELLAVDIAGQALARLGGAAELAQVGPDMCRIADRDRGLWAGLTVRHPRLLCCAGRIRKRGVWGHVIGRSMLVPDAGNIACVAAAIQELWRRVETG